MSKAETLMKLELTLPAGAADLAVGALGEISPGGFEEQEVEDDPQAVRFVVYGEPEMAPELCASMEALARSLRAAHGDSVRLASSEIPRENWREAWKVHFRLQRLDPFVICPSWIDHAPAPGEHLIALDPGSAFGTGLHETTRLCLRELATWPAGRSEPRSVLDFGCGTGILGIAACLLWPGSQVVAVDNDPLAISACEENAGRNGLAHRISARGELGGDGVFDLILANVSRPVLLVHAEALQAHVAPGGALVLSGLLAEDREAMVVAYGGAGLTLAGEAAEGDWLCLHLVRGAG